MNFKMVIFILGRLFILLGILLCLPLIVSLVYSDGHWSAFLFVIIGLLVVGIFMSIKKPQNTRIYAKEGFVIVASGWIFMALAGAVPLLLSSDVGNYIDCLFEITSGFTTTGASILHSVEALSPSMNFWRCFSTWIGGMGVLVFLLAVLPKMDNNMQSMHIFRAESPGPQVSKIVSKLKDTSRLLYGIYFALTFLEVVFLLFGGLNFYEAITCAMSTAGTGGFYIYNTSIGFFGSAYVEMVVAVFMVLFGVSFNVFYFILIGKVVHAFKSEELHWYLGIMLFSVLVVSVTLTINNTTGNYGESLRYGFFQVASIMSTTGFATARTESWPQLCQALLLFLMVIGASSCSTGGGIKVSRAILLAKSTRVSCKQMLSPNSVMTVKFEGKTVDETTITSVRNYLVIYVCFVVSIILLISVDNFDATTNISATLACLNNIGPGFSKVGTSGNYADFSIFSKLVLTVAMIAGRLELLPIVMLFNPKTWRA